jgi:predicted nucleotidyltransferase
MLIKKLQDKNLIHPPSWLVLNTHYLTQMGSNAYGVQQDDSDMDIYGFCMPPKEMLFPHLSGEIPGFGSQITRFEQFQQHHVIDKEAQKEYDFSIYSIVKFFQLCMENNPNMLDSLFVPRRCILHSTAIGELVRENRKLFLHKGCFHKYKGYAYGQASKIQNKINYQNEKRAADIEEFGYSLKYAYHLVRLLNECEQILIEGDLDLERNREQLKSIRRGEWTLDQIMQYFQDKEKLLEGLYVSSSLPHSPDEDSIKELLLQCIEMHYGDLSNAIVQPKNIDKMIADMEKVIRKYK